MPVHENIDGTERNVREFRYLVNGVERRSRMHVGLVDGVERVWFRRGLSEPVIQQFDTDGTCEKPDGAQICTVYLFHGGGGGAGSGNSGGSSGAGGGGGACDIYTIEADNLPDSINVVVGRGGTGGVETAFTSYAGNGTRSSFHTYAPATGQGRGARGTNRGLGGVHTAPNGFDGSAGHFQESPTYILSGGGGAGAGGNASGTSGGPGLDSVPNSAGGNAGQRPGGGGRGYRAHAGSGNGGNGANGRVIVVWT